MGILRSQDLRKVIRGGFEEWFCRVLRGGFVGFLEEPVIKVGLRGGASRWGFGKSNPMECIRSWKKYFSTLEGSGAIEILCFFRRKKVADLNLSIRFLPCKRFVQKVCCW